MSTVTPHDLLRTLYTMAMMVEARDAYTGGHLWRVAQFSRLLAQACGLSDREVERVALGGFLHDLGKVGVPDAVLNKPGKLTDEEYDIIKTHPRVGADLLAGHPLAALAMDAVLLHHETPDGRGYPQGLSGEAIPPVARMVGIADAFDAMTSSRPYRAGMPIARALDIIADNLGSQFDRAFGQHFIALGRAGQLEAIVGHSEPGLPLQSCPGCGPIIAVLREQQDGDSVLCPSCASEFQLSLHQGRRSLRPTGRQLPALARQPRANPALIESLVQAADPVLSAPRPRRRPAWLGG